MEGLIQQALNLVAEHSAPLFAGLILLLIPSPSKSVLAFVKKIIEKILEKLG